MTAATVLIEVQVFEGCPNADAALALARTVAERLGPGITVERVEVDSPARATKLGFAGSPSIRVDGQDIEGAVTSTGALSCRMYEGGAGVPAAWLVEAAVLRALAPQGILFLCVANSARSQMAEGIARSLAPPDTMVWSAGSQPTEVREEAIAVLEEIGIDISGHQSKAVADIPAAQVDVVIALCAEERCPVFLGEARRLDWALPDPAAEKGRPEQRLDAFRKARDELHRRLSRLFSVPPGV